MSNRLISLLLLFIPSTVIVGQKGYYVKDSTMTVGVQMLDGGLVQNARSCQIKVKDRIITYTPYEVDEYGFKDDKVYIARIITLDQVEKKVFLERLSKGNLTLYYYKDKNGSKFFLEKESGQMIEISKNDSLNKTTGFHESLMTYSGECKFMSDQLKYVTYTKLSMQKYATWYNNCRHKPFPRFRYGAIAGYGITRISASPEYIYRSIYDITIEDYSQQLDFKYDGGFIIGLFIDKPVSVSYFSLHAELYYARNAFSYNRRSEYSDVDLTVETNYLNLPVFFRYTCPFINYRPFVSAGGIYSFHLKSDSHGYTAIFNQNIIELNKPAYDLLTIRHQAGLTAGFGMQFNLSPKNSISVEIRYSKTYSIFSRELVLLNSFFILSGVNF
ncbi:MAG: PorT family protein [Bacteroidales bacterium]|nr:PorT family protein [Bacteroidales bacterium]